MAPISQQRIRRVSVEQLLRMTGHDLVPGHIAGHRLRRERGAGATVLRLSVAGAAVAAMGCLAAFAPTSKTSSSEQASPPSVSALPATSEPSPMPFAAGAPAPEPTSPRATTSASASGIPSVSDSPAPAPGVHRTASPAPATAVPAPVPLASCTVRFTISDSWPSGFTATVAITNTSGSAFSPWTLTWTFTAGQQITHGWDGEYSQTGGQVTVHPASYNPTIAPSSTISVGFNASYVSENPPPTGFAVNGASCARIYQ